MGRGAATALVWPNIRGITVGRRRRGERMFDPDEDYLTTQSRALLRAIQDEVAAADAGHVEENGHSLRLAEHLAAEGGVRRQDILAARELLLATSAWFRGNEDVADRFAAR